MFEDDEKEFECWAYMIETGEIIEYDEACSIESKDKYHNEICKCRKFVGLGYISWYTSNGGVITMGEPDLIYVNK